MVDGMGFNVRSCYWNKYGEEYFVDMFCVDILMFVVDGILI